jgi:phytoene synthase
LRAAAEYLLPSNVTGAELAALEDGWAALLEEHVDAARVAKRGIQLFRLAARLLGADEARTCEAGALYALVSVGRRGVPELLDEAGTLAPSLARQRFSRSLRPLTGLARLAFRDLKRGAPFEIEGSPPRFATMLRHRLTGRI